MPQLVKETTDFKRCCKKCGVNADVIDALKIALADFNFNITSKTQRIFTSPSKKSSLWDIRMGNPNKNKGASGGYRILAYFLVSENTFYLDYISEKADITKPSGKKTYINWERALKRYLEINN